MHLPAAAYSKNHVTCLIVLAVFHQTNVTAYPCCKLGVGRRTLEDMFADFAEKPVASGSIAQIHKAHLSVGGAHNSDYPAGTPVAVKVGSPCVLAVLLRGFCCNKSCMALLASNIVQGHLDSTTAVGL